MGCIQSKIRHHRCRRRRLLHHPHLCCNSHPPFSPAFPPSPPPSSHNQHLLSTATPTSDVTIPSANVTLRFSSLAQRGHYPDSPDKLNQDAFSIITSLQQNPNLHLFSVFDGHGNLGSECANFTKHTLTLTLAADSDLTLRPYDSFVSAFQTTNSLLRSSEIDDSMSGTTAISVLVHNDSLIVANVGDSRAVAGIWDEKRKCVVAMDLSSDQTPFRKDEYERVKECGARVLTVDQVEGIKDPEVQCWGEEESDDGDPPRLWVKDGMYPGTAFTRSVGDAMAEGIGVVPLPEVKELKITSELLFFVVASDGVFEFLSSQAVVDMVTISGFVFFLFPL